MNQEVAKEPNIKDVLKLLFARAEAHQEKGDRLAVEATREFEESKSFLRLAHQMAAKFPEAKGDEKTRGPLLANLSLVTFESLQRHLEQKAGRVKHVAKRLNVGEDLVRDLINAPNSKF